MKRWIVLLIVFAAMGSWIVLSGCNGSELTSDDVAECFWVCTGNTIVGCPDFCGSYCSACFATCFDCSFINNLECTGDPMQFCVDCGCAFAGACAETGSENLDGAASRNGSNE